VRRRMAWLGVAVAAYAIAMVAPALARAESLALSLGEKPTLNEQLSITVEGVADGAHRLYIYVESGGDACASDPYGEYTEEFGAIALSSKEGDLLSAGSYSKVYTYTPEANNVYSVCAYLDYTPSDPPDVVNAEYFAIPGYPVEAPYLHNPRLQEELKRIAVEAEQRERAHVKEREEQELRERQAREPASDIVDPERQAREEAERKASEGDNVRCIVPSLKGRPLSNARTALRKAHCNLGRVTMPRKHGRGALVVTTQSPTRGASLPQGATVAVTLRSRKR
jgi:hypothetical protein